MKKTIKVFKVFFLSLFLAAFIFGIVGCGIKEKTETGVSGQVGGISEEAEVDGDISDLNGLEQGLSNPDFDEIDASLEELDK